MSYNLCTCNDWLYGYDYNTLVFLYQKYGIT